MRTLLAFAIGVTAGAAAAVFASARVERARDGDAALQHAGMPAVTGGAGHGSDHSAAAGAVAQSSSSTPSSSTVPAIEGD